MFFAFSILVLGVRNLTADENINTKDTKEIRSVHREGNLGFTKPIKYIYEI